jgi:surface antigen
MTDVRCKCENDEITHKNRRKKVKDMTLSFKKITILILFMSFFFSSCASSTWQENQKAIIGGAGGAAAGGLIASALDANTAGVLGGIILGGLIGGAIGNRIDAADRREAGLAAHQALESAPAGTTTGWRNPDSGNSGTITPTGTYQSQNGQYCREYRQTVTIGDETQEAYGTACRRPDGKWRIGQ